MDDADKSLVSQNSGFVLIYRHFHLPLKKVIQCNPPEGTILYKE